MARSTMRTPTEMYPNGVALDAVNDNPSIHFRVNSDSQSWVKIKYYDNTDGTSHGIYYPKGGEMIAKHKGEIWSGYIYEVGTDSPFKLGHDYTGIMTVYQNEPESAEKPLNTGPGKYDVFVGRSKIKSGSDNTKTAMLDKDIMSIKPPVIYNGKLIGGAYLKIGNNMSLIESYSKRTGKATLADNLTGCNVTGTEYEIITNYIECEPFTFYCRSEPSVTITAERTYKGLEVSGVYSQAEGVAMQYYKFKLVKNGVVIDESDKKFTYTFEHTFPVIDGDIYTVICEVATQENYIKEFEITVDLTEYNSEIITNVKCDPSLERIKITWNSTENRSYHVFREDRIGNIKYIGYYASNVCYDYGAGNNQEYRYIVVSCKDGVTAKGVSAYTSVNDSRCFIAELDDNGSTYGRKKYIIGDKWTFAVDCDEGSITTANAPNIYDTTDNKPKVCYDSKDYESGTFTAALAQIIGANITDKYSNILRWNKFIGSHKEFLLKSGKGDCWIVSITSDLTRSYGSGNLRVTQTSYSWAETSDINRAVITTA